MLTLCMDTAYKYLTCALIKDDEIIASYSKECFKKQSEEIFLVLKEVFEKANIDKLAIDSVCISSGPGSYTGVRIAMSIAKVLCEINKIELYKISTLRLYAANKPNTMVLMDARSKRAYIGVYDNEKVLVKDQIINVEDIIVNGFNVVGDGSLVNLEDKFDDIPKAFLNTKNSWEKVNKIAYLVPDYLKESEEYYR